MTDIKKADYKKWAIVSTILGAIAFLAVFVRFVLGGPEDTWICYNGEWVKHGNPTMPTPTEACN